MLIIIPAIFSSQGMQHIRFNAVRFLCFHRLWAEFADVSFKAALISPKVVKGSFETIGKKFWKMSAKAGGTQAPLLEEKDISPYPLKRPSFSLYCAGA